MPTITIRLSEVERAGLVAAAQRSGVSLSEYVRQALVLRDGKTLDERVTALEEWRDG